jgi:dye decolorizing peroxidase
LDGPSTSRRAFLGGAGALAVASVAACTSDAPSSPPSSSARAVPADGARQAGVTAPAPPQVNLLLAVYDVAGSRPGTVLADVGRAVLALTGAADARLAGLAAGDLTITVGIGPRLVAAVDSSLPGAAAMPAFDRESIADAAQGGDLAIQVCASDPLVLPLALAAVVASAGGQLSERWRQRAARGAYVPVSKTIQAPRNVLGFIDGIVGAHTPAELDADIWLAQPAAVAGGTIMAVRRMTLDVDAFTALPLARQEAVFGRRRESGVPLSGGTIATDPDLGAKTATGAYLIPADAHLRRANALSTGVPAMLRRSYSIDDPAPGLLFVSFQNALRTFTATLTRMQTSDALLAFTTTTASGTFLVLPGHDAGRPLGSTLFGAGG